MEQPARPEEGENTRHELERLQPSDWRWVVICATSAVAVALYALLLGGIVGDVAAFLVAFLAGWIARTEWQVIANYRRASRAR